MTNEQNKSLLISQYGEYYGYGLYTLGYRYSVRQEKRILNYIDSGLSAYDIIGKL